MSCTDDYYGGGGGGGFLQGGSPYSQMGSPGSGQVSMALSSYSRWLIFLYQRNEAATSLRPINSFQYRKAEQPHNDAPWVLDGFEVGLVCFSLVPPKTLQGSLVLILLVSGHYGWTCSFSATTDDQSCLYDRGWSWPC